MDRDKRRSAEEEQELDRKIALIREKNQKIEQRSKEVEEDRARNDDSIGKSPKASQQTDAKKSGNNSWGREWDKGKTPADTWRENVPSMDLKGKLAGQKQNGGGGRNGPHQNNRNHNDEKKGNRQNNGPKIPARLEGRVTFTKDKEATTPNGEPGRRNSGNNGNFRRNGHGGGSGAQGQNRPVNNGGRRNGPNSEIKQQQQQSQEVPHPRRNQRNPQRNSGKERKDTSNTVPPKAGIPTAVGKVESETKKRANRPRREGVNYAVKKVVGQLVDKICWLERLEKRKSKKPTGEEDNVGEKEESEAELLESQETVQAPEVPEAPTESTEPDATKTSEEEPKPQEAPDVPNAPVESPKESSEEPASKPTTEEDANQNVISLVREKVATIVTTEVA